MDNMRAIAKSFMILSVSATLSAGAMANYLLISADDNVTNTRQMLIDAGLSGTVDIFDPRNATPTLALLSNYASVLVWSNYPYQNKDALGDVLADYVDMGGGVVEKNFSFHDTTWGLGGRFVSQGYAAVNRTTNLWGSGSLGTVHMPGHYVMSGVSTLSAPSFVAITTLTAGSVSIADWDNGSTLVAERIGLNGRVMALTFYGGDAKQWNAASVDNDLLMKNALEYAAVPEPATLAALGLGALAVARRRRKARA
jgi:hypothetical protein